MARTVLVHEVAESGLGNLFGRLAACSGVQECGRGKAPWCRSAALYAAPGATPATTLCTMP